MQTFILPSKSKKTVLALGAESAGNFSVHCPLSFTKGRAGVGFRTSEGVIHFSQDFGDLLEESTFKKFQKAVLVFLKKEKLRPDIILTDLHPLMKTTHWGESLAKKFKAKHIQIQHHHAHVFSAIGDCFIQNSKFPPRLAETLRRREAGKIQNSFYGISMDGTGYGTDEKIWGGEVFEINCHSRVGGNPAQRLTDSRLDSRFHGNDKECSIERIGHLENQTLLGGEIAIREPARILIGILSKFMSKKEIYPFVKKYYSHNEFELLYSQLQQNFNCLETSSTGRVLDAMSILLGFSGNERTEKHGPTYLLEKNSTIPYDDLKPKITRDNDGQFILDTTYLFKYVLKYVFKKDKKISADEAGRLAATAQHYIAQGLWEIIQKEKTELNSESELSSVFSGGLANNKIISAFLESQGAYASKKIPCGDAGLSFGQIVNFLLSQHSTLGKF